SGPVPAAVVALLCVGRGAARAAGPDEEAIAHVQAAKDASNEGNHRTAIKEYEAAFRIAQNYTILIPIALEYREMGNAHDARKILRQFLKEAPATHKKRGEAQALLNKLEAEKAAKGGD